MLVIVTILSIFIGLVMSIVISRRLAQPLYSITDSAAQLAKGHYDIKFEGAGYAETEDLADTLNYAAAELSKSDKLQKDLGRQCFTRLENSAHHGKILRGNDPGSVRR